VVAAIVPAIAAMLLSACGGGSPSASSPSAGGGCTFAWAAGQGRQSIGWAGGPLNVPVVAPSGCSWTVQSASVFVSVTVASGSANGSIHLDVTRNTGGQRVGNVVLADNSNGTVWDTLTVNQDSAPSVPPTAPTFLWFRSPPGEAIGGGVTHLFLPADSTFIASATVAHDSVSFGAGGYFLLLRVPFGQTIGPGPYEATDNPAAFTAPYLGFGGDGRGCNRPTGRFTIFEIVYSPASLVDRLHMTFEQHCDGAAQAINGEVWYVR
jgi:hypothetical protein